MVELNQPAFELGGGYYMPFTIRTKSVESVFECKRRFRQFEELIELMQWEVAMAICIPDISYQKSALLK